MGAKKITSEDNNKPVLIKPLWAVKISKGHFKHVGSIHNMFHHKRIKRYGPPRRAMVDLHEFIQYMGGDVDHELVEQMVRGTFKE